MIEHIFKLVWNRKWKSILIIIEIFFSFIVLFWVSTVAIYSYQNYGSPLGFSMEKVYFLRLSSNESTHEEIYEFLNEVTTSLKSIPEIKSVSYAKDVPFVSWGSRENIKHEGIVHSIYKWQVDNEFKKVMNLSLTKGRWFNNNDNSYNYFPIVITESFEDNFFGDNSGIGQTINSDGRQYKVVGVCENVRDDILSTSSPGYFIGNNLQSSDSISSAMFLINVNSVGWEQIDEKILNRITRLTKKSPKHWEVEGEPLKYKFNRQLSSSIFQFTIISIVWLFLLINVVLGLLGIFWLNINRRKAELGLRKAIGAMNIQIYKQIIGEAFALTTLGVLPAVLVALQFPLLDILSGVSHEVFFLAILISVFLIYVLVGLSVFYPSRMASKIRPAFALHED